VGNHGDEHAGNTAAETGSATVYLTADRVNAKRFVGGEHRFATAKRGDWMAIATNEAPELAVRRRIRHGLLRPDGQAVA